MRNLLSIEVEEYFQESAFESVCPPESWEAREPRVRANTEKVLHLLREARVKATFFVLGWVGERFPDLVREIAGCGHEISSHGYDHRRVCHQSREEFRLDVRRSKAILEDLTGSPVLGYRAPSYSITQGTLWAYDELRDAGYAYDSSVSPVRHDLSGIPCWPRFPFLLERLEGGNWVPLETERPGATRPALPGAPPDPSDDPAPYPTFLELPITTLRVLGKNVPISGGGLFRLFPYGFSRWGLTRIRRVDQQPFLFYVRTWEFDPSQPRLSGAGLRSRFRHYVNLGKTEARFRRLLWDFSFGTIREHLDTLPCYTSAPMPEPSRG